MKIPQGSFGNVIAAPRQAVRQQADTAVAEATQRLGNIAAGAAIDQVAINTREAEQRKDLEAKTAAARVRATTVNDLADLQDEVNRGILDGTIAKDKAEQEWADRSRAMLDGRTSSLSPEFSGMLGVEFENLQRKGANGVRDAVTKRNQQDTKANILSLGEQYERTAARDPQRAQAEYFAQIDALAPHAGLAPDDIQRMKAGFSEKVTYNTMRRLGQDAMQSGDPKAVEAARQRVNSPEGDALDPTRRTALDQTLFGWQQSMEAKQEREADKAERLATKRYNEANTALDKGIELSMSGAYLSPDFIADLSTKAAGTGLERQVNALLASQKQVAGFASMPPDQRAESLNAMRARRANPATGVTPEQNELILRAERIDDNLRKQVDENAWSAAQSVGVIQQAPQIAIGDANQAISVIGQRMQEIGTVEAWAGKKVSPLQPDEADQVTRLVRVLPADQAAGVLGQMGALVGDADRVAAVAKQLQDKDGVIGTAMAFASSKTTQGRYTAELVLRGEQAIKDKAVKPDGAVESGWRAQIAKQVRGAYSNQQAEDQIINAAFLITAAKGGDVENAINLATGGIIERNGGKLPLPYGMKEPEFEKRLGAITLGDVQSQAPGGFVMAGQARLPLDKFVQSIPDAQLVHAGQGVYNVRAGGTLVTNEQGKRIALQIGPRQ